MGRVHGAAGDEVDDGAGVGDPIEAQPRRLGTRAITLLNRFWVLAFALPLILLLNRLDGYSSIAEVLLQIVGILYALQFIVLPLLLRSPLRHRGFAWVGIWEAVGLHYAYGTAVWRIPHRDDAAVLPDYSDDDIGLKNVLHRAVYDEDWLSEFEADAEESRVLSRMDAHWSKHGSFPPPDPLPIWHRYLCFQWPLILIPFISIAVLPVMYRLTRLPLPDQLLAYILVYVVTCLVLVLATRWMLDGLIILAFRKRGYTIINREDLKDFHEHYYFIGYRLPSLEALQEVFGQDWDPLAEELAECIAAMEVDSSGDHRPL